MAVGVNWKQACVQTLHRGINEERESNALLTRSVQCLLSTVIANPVSWLCAAVQSQGEQRGHYTVELLKYPSLFNHISIPFKTSHID